MSDQVSGPTGYMIIMIGLLFYGSLAVMPWLMGESMRWYDWLVPLPAVIPCIGLGIFFLTHEYWWWPTHAEDRVARIRELVDEPDCGNPPGGKT